MRVAVYEPGDWGCTSDRVNRMSVRLRIKRPDV